MAYYAGPIDCAEEYDRHSTIAQLCNLLIVLIAFTYLSILIGIYVYQILLPNTLLDNGAKAEFIFILF